MKGKDLRPGRCGLWGVQASLGITEDLPSVSRHVSELRFWS